MKKALSLLIAMCMVLSVFPVANAAGIEDYPALTYGESKTIMCSGSEVYLTFTPEMDGNYRFSSNSAAGDFIGVLYDASMEQIARGDDCWDYNHDHSNYGDFCFSAFLKGGVTYVLGVDLWASDVIPVSIMVSCGHSYDSEITRKATCALPGIETYTCTVCGDSYEEEIWVEHTYLSEITDKGTCAVPGTVVHTCVVCGYASTEEYRVAHDYEVEVIREATCAEDGLERYTCTACGYSYEYETWSGHEYVYEVIVEGTCDQIEIERRTCTVCGRSYEEEGGYRHNWEEVIVQEPTCDEEGSYIDRCTDCGESDGTWSIDALGHSYNEELVCDTCGETAPTSGAWEHLSWSIADGVLTITGVGEMPEILIIDAYYTEYIDNTPWKDMIVREVIIGEGITNVTTALFMDREELEKVTLPSTLKTIKAKAFEGCSLTEIVLPEGLTYIGRYAFAYCDLRRIHIPADAEIDTRYTDVFDSFTGNTNLEQITVDERNPLYCSDDQGVLYSKDMTELMLVPYGIEGTYVLPASVTKILTVFSDCAGLDTILVEEGSTGYESRDGVLYLRKYYTDSWDENGNRIYGCMDNVLYACPPAKELGHYTIDDRTGGLSMDAFKNCTGLTELSIPKTCTTNIGHYDSSVFRDIVEGCSNLEAVWFEEGHPDCFSDAEGFVYNAVAHGISLVGHFEAGTILEYVPAARTEAYLEIPEGVQGVAAVLTNPNLRAIRFPSTLRGLASHILTDCTLDWILFTGDEPTNADMEDTEWATNLTAKVYYPDWLTSWKPCYLDVVSCDLTYIPYAQGSEPVWGGEGNPFTDVPVDSFYCEPVMWAVENGITNGLTADTFGPTATCNRAQVVTFLWRAAGCPEPESATHSFVDVQAGSFYEKPVLWAVENGITTGSDATHFNPTGQCNRAQVVTFMYRTFQSPEVSVEGLPFTDVPAGSWYEAPIAWAVAGGITNGLDATHFGPNAVCNRAQVVTFLYRAFAE